MKPVARPTRAQRKPARNVDTLITAQCILDAAFFTLWYLAFEGYGKLPNDGKER